MLHAVTDVDREARGGARRTERGAGEHERAPEHDGHEHGGHEHAHDGHADEAHAHGPAARKPKGGRDHAHDHDHDLRTTPLRRLVSAFAITFAFMFIEAGVGVWSKSLALVADAGHMLSDAAALGLAIFAQRIAAQTRTRQRTYGYRRAEVLAAFANGIALGITALWIFAEAAARWRSPPSINAPAMLVTATAGLFANILSAWILSRGQHGHNPNTRAAFAHVMADALGSVGAIVAGVLVLTLGWTRADPTISAFIGVLVLWGGYRLVRDTSRVLMEGSPVEIRIEHIEETLRSTPGVVDFHDLHVWSISEGFDVLTVHIVIARGTHGTDVVAAAAKNLREKHGIDHVTIQPEPPHDDRLVPLRRPPRPAEHEG
jgi:cobalt-zinc-cadmium efflux system protein